MSNVTNTSEALAYMLDCSLATVCDMAGKKSRNKSEYVRQISIAQKALAWAVAFGADISSTRGRDVMERFSGNVDSWAQSFEDKK